MKTGTAKRSIIRMASVLIALALMVGAMPATASALAAAVTRITLDAIGDNGTYAQSEYTNAQQLGLLMDLLPVKSQIIPKADRAVGQTGVIVRMKVYKGTDAVAEEWVFAPSYTMEQSKGSAFDWYTTSLEKWNLMLHLAGYNPDRFRGTETYNGEKITGFYTLDGNNHSYNAAVNYADVSFLVEKLEKASKTPNQTAKAGFLLFTEKGRYAWYYPEAKDIPGKTLQNFSATNNSYDTMRRAQWLAYVDPNRISSITFSAMGGRGYTVGNSDDSFSIGVTANDKATIETICAYIKNIKVAPNAETYNSMVNFNMSAGVFEFHINLTSGEKLYVGGYESSLTVSSSELDKAMSYKVSETQIRAMRDFMSLLPGATLNAM